MLHRYCSQFLAYCELADFSARSVQALTIRLNELANFLKIQRNRSIKRVHYRHLIDFAADYNAPSIHVTKFQVWTLRQFYHFLTFHRIRNLLKMGTHPNVAIPMSFSRKGPWKCARTLATQTGMTNQWLKDRGLLNVKELWVNIHYPTTVR